MASYNFNRFDKECSINIGIRSYYGNFGKNVTKRKIGQMWLQIIIKKNNMITHGMLQVSKKTIFVINFVAIIPEYTPQLYFDEMNSDICLCEWTKWSQTEMKYWTKLMKACGAMFPHRTKFFIKCWRYVRALIKTYKS